MCEAVARCGVLKFEGGVQDAGQTRPWLDA